MTSVPFPVIGVVAPMAVAGLVWSLTGSTFALLGAVIAPTMVVAHHIDGVRRANREARRIDATKARERAAEQEAAVASATRRIAAENRGHPSVADITRNSEWLPARNGDTVVRAGHHVDGSPWLIDISTGVSVVGTSASTEAVWSSLVVHATAQLGSPLGTGIVTRWANGASIVRGDSREACTVIRCNAKGVESVTPRGSLPVRIDVEPDDTAGAGGILASMATSRPTQLDVSLNSDTPHLLIAGRTGSGKSHVLTALVVGWANRHATSEFQFIGIDFKGGATLNSLRVLPHHLATLTDLTAMDVPRAIAGIFAEIRRREAEFVRQGVSSIENASGVSRLAIVIDEVQEFLRQFPAGHDLLADVARRGRSLGLHLVLAVQHPNGVLRDAVLVNTPVRICLAMNTQHDIIQVLGRATAIAPARGRVLVTFGDGLVHEREVPQIDVAALDDLSESRPGPPPWLPALTKPVERNEPVGFGLIDDVSTASYGIATWHPRDGDVVVFGERGSGRTETLHALVNKRPATWVTTVHDLETNDDVVVIDNLDCLLDSMGPNEATVFLDTIRRRRSATPAIVVVISTTQPLPRAIGPIRNVVTLRTPNLDAHRATGAPPETFDPACAPGVGTWRGLRFVLYARTESSDTASRP